MIVRTAYTNGTLALCREHYDNPPSWLPPLGEVRDARWQLRDQDCEVCRAEPGHAERARQERARS